MSALCFTCYTTRDNPALDSARREFPEEPTRSPYPCCPPLSRHAPPPPHAPPPQRVSARACRCVRDQHPRGLGGSTRQRALGSGERCMGFGDGPAGGAHTGVTGVWVLGVRGGWGGWYWCLGNSIRATGTADGSARQQSTYCGPHVRLSPAYCAYTPHTFLQPAADPSIQPLRIYLLAPASTQQPAAAGPPPTYNCHVTPGVQVPLSHSPPLFGH